MHPLAHEQTQPLEVGEMYRVQCIRVKPDFVNIKLWIPIVGERHADHLETGFPADFLDPNRPDYSLPHIHVDMRFLTKKEMEMMGFSETVAGAVRCIADVEIRNDDPVDIFYVPGKIKHRRCLRQWQTLKVTNFDWNAKLRVQFERKYQNHQINPKCPTCPHQGFDLSTVEPDELGRRICPGHRLIWSKKGKLIPSF